MPEYDLFSNADSYTNDYDPTGIAGCPFAEGLTLQLLLALAGIVQEPPQDFNDFDTGASSGDNDFEEGRKENIPPGQRKLGSFDVEKKPCGDNPQSGSDWDRECRKYSVISLIDDDCDIGSNNGSEDSILCKQKSTSRKTGSRSFGDQLYRTNSLLSS